MRSRRGATLCLAAGVLVAACAAPPAPPDMRALELLMPTPAMGKTRGAGAWTVTGLGTGDRAPRLALAQVAGVPALRVVPGDRPLRVFRPVRSDLLVTPYLSWSWNVSTAADGGLPLAVVVGFASRNEPQTAAGSAPQTFRAVGKRAVLVMSWDSRGLRRGTLERAPDIGPDAFRYVVRGGAENGGNWWVETVDLSAIYQQAWPDRPPSEAVVTFIGMTVEPGAAEATAHIAGIALSR